MKNILVMLSSLVVFAACKSSVAESVRTFIPGTYIRFSEHEFGKVYDTLAITLQNELANEYRIVRRWRYERVLDGRKIEPEYKIRTTTALFDENRKLLTESESQLIYTFDPAKDVMYAGKNAYHKIK